MDGLWISFARKFERHYSEAAPVPVAHEIGES